MSPVNKDKNLEPIEPNLNPGEDVLIEASIKTKEAVENLETPLEGVLQKTAQIAKNTEPKEIQKVEIVIEPNNDDMAKAFFAMLKGKEGEAPSDEKLTGLIKPLITKEMKGDDGPQGKQGLKGEKGEKGDMPKTEKLVDIIMPLIPDAKTGPSGPKGGKGDKGADGIGPSKDELELLISKALDKKDSSLTTEAVLELLKGEISYDDLKDLPDIERFLSGKTSSRDYDLIELKDVVITSPTNGQALTYDTATGKWVNGSAAGSGDVATDVIWDAKGDLAGGTGADTAARLAVGANGTVLTADSTEVTGLKWVAAGTGDVSAAANLGNNLLIRGDGAAKGVQNSGITVDDSDNITGLGTLNTHTIPGGTGTFALTSGLHAAVTLAGTPNYLTLSGQEITLTKLDITDDTNLVAGTNITLTTNTLSVDDSFILNTGDIGAGVYDFGGATSFEIPNSATPTVNADGEIAIDTTVTDFSSGVLKYYSGEEMGVVAMPIAQFTSPTNAYIVSYNSTNDEFELVAQSGGGEATLTEAVVQTSHGFSVGEIIKSSGTDDEYATAQADSAANAEAVGVVTAVADANNFTFTYGGMISTAAAVPNNTAGTVLYLDPDSAGAVTTTEPTTTGDISKPIAVIVEANAQMLWIHHRGMEIADGGTAAINDLSDVTITSVADNEFLTYDNGTSEWINQTAGQVGIPTLTILASTSNGEGASLIGIEDSGTIITATTVEGALAENRAAIDVLEAAGYITASSSDTLTNKTLTSPTLTNPALGTPSLGVLTNATGLPAAAVVAGSFGTGAYVMDSSLQVATIELGDATDTTIARVGAGVVSIEGVNILTTAGGTLTGTINLGEGADPATTGLVIDESLSADERYSGTTIPGTAGATLAFGDLCYLDVTAGEWLLADASAAGTAGSVVLGICVDASTDGVATSMLLNGTVRSAAFPASIALGAPVYVSETAGEMTATAPTTTDAVIRVLGWAVTVEPNTIYFNPSTDYITHT